MDLIPTQLQNSFLQFLLHFVPLKVMVENLTVELHYEAHQILKPNLHHIVFTDSIYVASDLFLSIVAFNTSSARITDKNA